MLLLDYYWMLTVDYTEATAKPLRPGLEHYQDGNPFRAGSSWAVS